jgi:hypothetical protein
VNVLKSIEKRMEKTVEGIFGKAFKSSVQPVELAHKLAKEMGDHKSVSVSRVYVPNEFDVYLAPSDFEQLHSFEATLVEELASYLIAFARRESWTLVAKPVIVLHADDDLGTGEFGIATRTGSAPAPDAAPAPVGAAAAAALAAPPPPGMSQTVVFQPPLGEKASTAEPVAAVEPRTCGVLRVGDSVHQLTAAATVIGRSRQSDIVVGDPNVSRRHCEVRREGDDYVVIDLGSTNGILLNGRQVQRAGLAEGDRLQLGSTVARFELRPC